MNDRQPTPQDIGPHAHEPHDGTIAARLTWLRAGVLGANDGIVSVAGIVVGVAGATADSTSIALAGVAGVVAGALSMAAGEYVSVSTQLDAEQALLHKERRELVETPAEELAELAGIYQAKGLRPELALQVAQELTERDALAAHAEAELGIDPDELARPWHAAFASMLAFTLGALLPLLVIASTPDRWRVAATGLAVAAALGLTGWVSARLGGAPAIRAVVRNVGGGVIAMLVTYLIGIAFGVALVE